MKRVRNHIIEDESEHLLKGIVPSEWVLRKLSPDYGIDYIVEVFEDYQATGQHFFIQLKGTDRSEKNQCISYQLDRKYYEYYSKLSMPILFVYCSVTSCKVWGKWMNRGTIGEDAKSRKVSFSSSDILTKDRFYETVKSLSIDNTPVTLRYRGIEDTQLQTLLEKWVKSIFKDDLAQNNTIIADEIIIHFSNKSPEGVSLKVSDDRFAFDITTYIPTTYKEDLLLLPEIDSLPKSLHEFLFVLGKILLSRNSKEALRLLMQLIPVIQSYSIEDIHAIVVKCVNDREFQLLEEKGKAAIDNGNWNNYQYLNLILLLYHTDKNIQRIQESMLLHAISKSKDVSFTGLLHYNLANHYQAVDRRKAIRHYVKATRKEPDYCNRGYWQREFAGMLFMEKRYSCSAKLYEKCLKSKQFEKDPLTFALAADACFMARNLSRSLQLFEKYTEMATHHEMEFVLKRQTIKEVRDSFGLEGPFFPSSAVNLYKKLEMHSQLNSKEKLKECLILDPLCPRARFQEGRIYLDEENFEGACISFLISALVAEWDIGAWLNSFLAAVRSRNHLMGVVLRVAYEKYDYTFIQAIREEFIEKVDIPAAIKNVVIDALREQFQMYEEEPNGKKSL